MGVKHEYHSLVPRASLPPVFDHLQYVKNGELACSMQKWREVSLHFCIPQAFKNWRQGRPGNEARILYILH